MFQFSQCNWKQGSLADSDNWEDLLGSEERGKDEKQLSRPEGSKWILFYYNFSNVLKKLNVGDLKVKSLLLVYSKISKNLFSA